VGLRQPGADGDLYDDEGMPVWVRDENGEIVRDEKGHRVHEVNTWTDMTPAKRKETLRLLQVMADEVRRQFPDCTVLFEAIHLDETNPHLQMGIVPTTADGRINAREVLGGGKGKKAAQAAWSRRHDDMRERLQEENYDATMMRLDPDPSRPRKDLRGYKEDRRRADEEAEERREELEQAQKLEADLEPRLRHVAAKEAGLNAQQRHIEAGQTMIDTKKDELRTREAALDARQAGLDSQRLSIEASQRALISEKEDIDRQWVEIKAERAAASEAAAGIAAQARRTATETLSEARRRAEESDLGRWLREHDPEVLQAFEESLRPPRGPRSVALLRVDRLKGEKRLGRELLAVPVKWADGRRDVRLELRADDPAARGQAGLQIGKWTKQGPLRSAHMSEGVQGEIKAAAAPIRVGKTAVYPIRADLTTSLMTGLTVKQGTVRPSQLPAGPDVLDRQQDAEESVQARQEQARMAAYADEDDDQDQTDDGPEME
jgi:diadenosine tetraphosphate (Ap4A) HIT family hydrolase